MYKRFNKIWLLLLLLTTTAFEAYSEDWYRVLSLRGMWNFSIGDNLRWAEPEYNDQDWETIYAPSAWENEGFHGYNGHAWYRKTFDGSDLEREKKIFLHLGYIDDVDEVFVNGKLVGSSGSFPPKFSTAYNAYRKYLIPDEMLNFEGENTIAVRVYDVTQGGGIVSGKIGLFIDRDQMHLDVDLQGIWDFKIGDNQQWREKDYDHSRWRKVSVPGPWEKQGYHGFDGFAWYRKRFYLPENIDPEELVLLLGKIDDFDKTYVNGEQIGYTKDYRGFGSSGSFQELRSYSIPSGILIPGAYNTIAVRVEDIGNIGGIYEGPVGLTTQNKFTKFWRWRR